MARLSIEVPEYLRSKMEARVAETGHESIEHYVRWLVREDADSVDHGGPDTRRVGSREHLVEVARQGLESPAREMTAADWDEMRRRSLRSDDSPGDVKQ
ncbi:MAG: hypothetical protein WBD40_07085 [Tepidisphaeraceae bacterium]